MTQATGPSLLVPVKEETSEAYKQNVGLGYLSLPSLPSNPGITRVQQTSYLQTAPARQPGGEL